MIQHRFSRLFDDPAEYTGAQAHWHQVVQRLTASLPGSETWEAFGAGAFANGTPLRDGNPIYFATSADSKRSLRILQWPPRQLEEADLTAYLTSRHGADEAEGHIDELTVGLAFSDEASATATNLLSAWLREGTTAGQMEVVIDAFARPISPKVPVAQGAATQLGPRGYWAPRVRALAAELGQNADEWVDVSDRLRGRVDHSIENWFAAKSRATGRQFVIRGRALRRNQSGGFAYLAARDVGDSGQPSYLVDGLVVLLGADNSDAMWVTGLLRLWMAGTTTLQQMDKAIAASIPIMG